MAKFEVLVERVATITDHPNADRLSVVTIRGYNCISAKLEDGSHRYATGALVVYVPEGAVVPEYLLRQGFWDDKRNQGILAGSQGNRVKAIKLRGMLSQGILFPVVSSEPTIFDVPPKYGVLGPNFSYREVKEGDDVAEFLGIVKYEPMVPSTMSGQVRSIGIENAFKYDIENIKKYPNALEGYRIVATEKLHGTLCVVGCIPGLEDDQLFEDGSVFISSKGMMAKGLVLYDCEENRKNNLYVRTALSMNLPAIAKKMAADFEEPVYLFGEVFGRGVQDLGYGIMEPTFRLFDIICKDGPMSWYSLTLIAEDYDIPTVPVLMEGKYDLKEIEAVTNGLTAFDGHNIREGVVVRPLYYEVNIPPMGRGILKSVSEDYLLRKDGTEFN